MKAEKFFVPDQYFVEPAPPVLAAGSSVDLPILVELTTPGRFLTLGREWRDLVARAVEPNVFMEPTIVAAAASTGRTPIHVLLAWRAGTLRLEGAWALAVRRPSSGLPMPILKAPVHDHAFLGSPVLDRDAAADALAAMFEMIADEPDLPDLVEVGSLDTDATLSVFDRVLEARNAGFAVLERRLRPALHPGREVAPLTGSRAKALRRRRRRLNESGQVACTTHLAAAEIGPALQEFLALEAAGWKGRTADRGRAILKEPALEAFVRAAVGGLAEAGLATITALRVDGRAVAMQLTIRSGGTAFTWKSAYDEGVGQLAPGIVLLQEVTAALLADRSLAGVDSCNHRDDGYMAEFWAARRAVADVVVDVRAGSSVGFRLVLAAERSHRRLRAGARVLWHAYKARQERSGREGRT